MSDLIFNMSLDNTYANSVLSGLKKVNVVKYHPWWKIKKRSPMVLQLCQFLLCYSDLSCVWIDQLDLFLSRIDMYVEGLADLNELISSNFFQPADKKEEHLATVMDKAATRYFPVYEKVRGKDVTT